MKSGEWTTIAALLTMPDGLAVQRLINRQAEAIKLRAVAEVVNRG